MINGVIIGVIAMLTCSCYYILQREKTIYKSWVRVIYLTLYAVALISFLLKVGSSIHTPGIWDFTVFYVYGKVAASGYNFYQPENFRIVFDTIDLPFTNFGEFVTEIIDVGFLYPPPTMLYYMPLGFISYKTALICWTIFNLCFAFGSLYLIYSLFLKSDKLIGFVLVSILFFISSQVRSTIFFSQTNFILLFILLLMKKHADGKSAGILLAIATFTKPYMIIFGLLFLITKKWKPILSFLGSSLIICLFTIIIFGKDTFFSYFSSNSTQRLPAWVFKEGVNQSLHAVLLRANLISIDQPWIYMVVTLLILGLTTLLLFYLIKKEQYDFIWVFLLLTGLLIYPGTLSHYGVLLLFIIFQFFQKDNPLYLNARLSIPIIGIFYFLNSVSVFSAICFLIIFFLLKVFRSDFFEKFEKFQLQTNN